MISIRPLGDAELARLGDDELVAYAVRAREAGDDAGADRALQIFAFGLEDALRAFVRNRLDSHGDAAIEEVAERALEDAIRSIRSLRGETAPEARAFVFKIARLRVVDYHRRGRVQTAPLEAGAEAGGSDADATDTALVLEGALAELRPDHKLVVERFVLSGYSARETAELVRRRLDGQVDDSMSEQNVHQIGSRFRRDLRARLEEAERQG